MAARRSRAPAGRFLEHSVPVLVRFQEVDALRMVWHGHYLSYFEDARQAFGRHYGLSYRDMLEAGFVAPLVHASRDFLEPARLDDQLLVTARLYEREAARLEFFYRVRRRADDAILATGRTVQVFMSLEQELLLTMPDHVRAFYAQRQAEMKEE